jgi:hypothetical protein
MRSARPVYDVRVDDTGYDGLWHEEGATERKSERNEAGATVQLHISRFTYFL